MRSRANVVLFLPTPFVLLYVIPNPITRITATAGQGLMNTVPNWTGWQPGIRATLMFIVDEAQERVLLIRKKRGLGAGKINGPGGKMDPGETSVECAIRETQEELGVTALNPVLHGELWFQFVDGLALHVDVYRATEWEGDPIETPEAIPLWTALSALPFEEMWADDRFWLGELLIEKKNFIGKFLFDDDTMLSNEIEWPDRRL